MTQVSRCAIRQADFKGWNAYHLENGLIRLVAVPEIGGRIMAYDLGEYAYLFVDRDLAGQLFSAEENQGDGSLAAWKNYGGDKTWPAPQGWDDDTQWHGPPDPVLDTGRYSLTELTGDDVYANIGMTSPPDHRTGVQIVRRASLRAGSTRVTLDLTFHNIKDRPICWSIWDVVQLRAERIGTDGRLTHEPGCVMTTPLNPDSQFESGYHVMFGEPDNPQWQTPDDSGLFFAPYMWHIGKVGLDSDAGWVAFSNTAEGYGFAKMFTYEAGQPYPDNGSSVEIWTIGAGQVANLNYADSDIYLMEAEVLSPLREIAPHGKTSFQIEWGACRCDGAILAVQPAGVCTAQPTLTASDDGWHLRGGFGVFDEADLLLRGVSADGQTGATLSLGAVSPLRAVTIDRQIGELSDVATVILLTRAHHDGTERQLATLPVPTSS
ncbi:MAG: DUF4380 domain-containing protein [Anaerolineaceae bacterium]|nr:MAG: DUF4380 domain-containing protein [Anaerolineaceae bacterium]